MIRRITLLLFLQAMGISYAVADSPAKEHLIVLQIHYAPLSHPSAEYIEVMNTSFSETIDLTGVRFTSGVEFDFTGADITSLAPGRRMLIVKDKEVFESVYGSGALPGFPPGFLPSFSVVGGEFANGSSLDDQGEFVVLKDAAGETIFSMHYRANAQWPHMAGHAITYLGNPYGFAAPIEIPDPSLPASWEVARGAGGLPGGLTPGFRSWLAERGRTDALAVVDGQTELLNYALARDLVDSYTYRQQLETADGDGGSSGFSFEIGGGDEVVEDVYMTLEVSVRSFSNVNIEFQTSTNLVNWAEPANYEILDDTDIGDGISIIKYRLNDPVQPGQQVYMRLKVEE